MTVESVSESYHGRDAAPLLATPNATVRTLIDNRFVENMPLNGGSFSALIDRARSGAGTHQFP